MKRLILFKEEKIIISHHLKTLKPRLFMLNLIKDVNQIQIMITLLFKLLIKTLLLVIQSIVMMAYLLQI
jgi:hypothetical protein